MAKFKVMGGGVVSLLLKDGTGLTLQPGVYDLPADDPAVKTLVGRKRLLPLEPQPETEAEPQPETEPETEAEKSEPSVPLTTIPSVPVPPPAKPQDKASKQGKKEAAPSGKKVEPQDGFDDSALGEEEVSNPNPKT